MRLGPLPAAVLLIASMVATPTVAASALEGARIAVLEFKVDPSLPVQSPETLVDECRGAVVELTRGAGALVLTRENMLDVLKITGGTCREGECEVETARNLNVTFFVAGNLTRIEGTWMLTLKLFETRSGALLAQERVQAGGELALLDRIRTTALILVRKAFNLPSGGAAPATSRPGQPGPGTPRPPSSSSSGGTSSVLGEVTDAATATAVTFTTSPPGAAVLVDGALVCPSTPCTRGIPPGRHDVVFQKNRHLDARMPLEARPGASVSATLSPTFGVLRVESQPTGLEVRINDAHVGLAPLEREVDSGGVEVTVADACHVRTGERIVLRAGERRTVRYVPKLAQADLRVDAVSTLGAPTRGELYVDGVHLGKTGNTVRVPLCSQEARVQMDNDVWTGRLHLVGHQLNMVRAVSRGRPAQAPSSTPPPQQGSAPPERPKPTPIPSAPPPEGKTAQDAAPPQVASVRAPKARGETQRDPKTGLVWIRIPPGTFTWGCEPQDTACDDDEKPSRHQDVPGFWMLATEVTVAAYEACLDDGACNADDVDHDAPERTCNAPNARSTHPMNCIDWAHADEFCRSVGGRLPTGVEWEYAAKSGTSRIFPWGDEPMTATRANHCDRNCPNALPTRDKEAWRVNGWIGSADDGWAATAPVGSYPSGDTPWGLKDMAGNVFEWTSTPGKGDRKEVRGGGYNYKATALRASMRVDRESQAHLPSLGFRCVR